MSNHRRLDELPHDFQSLCFNYADGLTAILDAKLYGIYLYGAAVFADGGPVQDVDCHVILRQPLTPLERERIRALHDLLAAKYPPLGGELDAYYILYAAARLPRPPQHQLSPDTYDKAWALHCAHVRAGQFEILYGPAPVDIFPEPSWAAVDVALENELNFVRANLHYPAYCVLNLCRIIYSVQARDVVVSKRYAAQWAHRTYPQWSSLFVAAEQSYDSSEAGSKLIDKTAMQAFLLFAERRIQAAREAYR